MEKNWFDLLCRPYKELEKDQQESIYKNIAFLFIPIYMLYFPITHLLKI